MGRLSSARERRQGTATHVNTGLIGSAAVAAVCVSVPFFPSAAPAISGAALAAATPAIIPALTERHLTNFRQLTSGGENAEAYFSADGQRLIYQSTRPEYPCDQIYTIKTDGTDVRRVSTGTGRTTCGYFYPGGREILFASTHERSLECPPRPSYARGYVWPIYESYDIYRAEANGSNLTPLTRTPGYDAEATIAPDGLIVFTSVRDGDMEIYSMKADGSDVRRLTNRPGPDGGPFFSWDGRRIVFRGREPGPGAELDDYRALLKEGLWRPTELELFVMDRDGGSLRQVTKLGGANFAPFFASDGRRIIFSSNHKTPRSRNFDLYLVNLDGTGLEQVTTHAEFDGFPMFSPDGTRLVFASNRGAARPGDTNVFIADWVD
jgi:Tol biopolymer transport system component